MLRRLSSPVFFLLLFIPLVALIAAGLRASADADFNQRLARRQAQEASDVAQGVGALERTLQSAADDVSFLAELPRLQEAMADPSALRLEKLGETLRAFAHAKRAYDQIRWLDEAGMEKVRVDFDRATGLARVLPAGDLQDKSGRYYFHEANALAPGAIYLSPFDLKISNGGVARPLRPTLRLAAPLVDGAGRRHGILILNLFGDRLVARMVAAASDIDHMQARLQLVDRKGYWLHGMHAEDEWGFMLGRPGQTLARRQPEAWAAMQAREAGQDLFADGLWTWQRLHPVVPLQPGHVAAQAFADDYVWWVAALLPSAELAALHAAAWQRLVWPLAVLLLLALGACTALTRYRARVRALDAALLRRLEEAEASNHQLAAQERLIRTITDHLPSKVSYWDRELHCRYANAAYFDWFGLHPEQMLGMHLRDVLGAALFAESEAATHAALAGSAQRFERRIEKFDGKVGYLQTHYIPDQVDGRVEGLYVLSSDITELKEAGLRLSELNAELSRRVEEVVGATRAKDDFLSNMSHEIRTPLNAILGLAYLLDSRPLSAEDKDLVRKIRGAGRLLLGLISDILDYSKIEAGRLELEHVPFRLGDVLDGVAAIMATTVGDKDIELTVDAVPKGAEHLLGDALRLGQVLNNLVSNALKFTEHGAVSLHAVLLGTGAGRRLRFAVCDSGIGIAPEKQALIFDAFSQADTSTTRKYGGTGLGLSISRYLVREMGGELTVRSRIGAGSEFSFELPFEAADSAYAAPSMALQRVLIADDSAIARETLAAIVQSLGWSAETVASGVAALQRWREQAAAGRPFDLLLIDWLMPEMDGLAASKAVRETCAAGDSALAPPIIAMVTAHSRDALLQQADAVTTDLVLTKPLTASMLYNAVAEAKRRRGQGELVPAPGMATQGRQLPGLRVLVVDDSEINCEVAARILSAEGARVHSVGDGQSALDWLAQYPEQVDVVLMDVQMPVMDGYEATRQIRARLGLQALPVIALTAGAFNYQRDAALAAGMNDFLAKPFDVAVMIATLQGLTGCRPEAACAAPPELPELPGGAEVPALPGIDVALGMHTWGGDGALYRKYLRHFCSAYGEAGRRIGDACRSGDRAAAAALAHKLSGAAGNLALTEVARISREVSAVLHQGADIDSLAAALQQAVDTVAASLAQWQASTANPAAGGAGGGVDADVLRPLLRELLAALDRDSPRHAEPALVALAAHLPADKLVALRECVDAFDFRAAEVQVRTLAAESGISLE
jgi:PAS domain S-box-containing protein